ncbi:D-glycero-beta-D-manno-heptose 1,7-bisphosphate 7-phosphatase [Maribellus comscasis]|uniref:D,D-heptose 1,7-bisphosphate phosphatase n=1 Tax=Maribellus comscasis TaxID=2681766 RepID=A0A6I6JSL0_9BACT|nr:HAD family hydrolase [Maribellus comscasis]QGY43117.1 D-glycero-beta-D-manno-heptose 1,7-bisphosphate 7-phosphatase [Maribellus comscasis]
MKGKNKALFLDRDGTINIEKNYVYKIEDFEFIPGIFDLISDYQKEGFLIFIVTNQSGIARGMYTEIDYEILTRWMINQFKQKGIYITKVYHCPHHPEITGECNCRKPNPGMILQAIETYNISPVNSVLIGDKKRDFLAGKKAGIGKNLYIQDVLGNN